MCPSKGCTICLQYLDGRHMLARDVIECSFIYRLAHTEECARAQDLCVCLILGVRRSRVKIEAHGICGCVCECVCFVRRFLVLFTATTQIYALCWCQSNQLLFAQPCHSGAM